MAGERTNILLVEDHDAFREALAFVFEREPDFTVVGQTGSLEETHGLLEGTDIPVDVAVVDLRLPDGDGIDLVAEFSKRDPRITTLVLSASLEPEPFARAAEAGADGLLHKAEAVTDIVDAVRHLRMGDNVLSPNGIVEMLRIVRRERMQEEAARLAVERLTRREKEILQTFAEGLDSKAVAEKLGIAVETERTHVMNILNKLAVHSRLQALVFAVRQGIVEIH